MKRIIGTGLILIAVNMQGASQTRATLGDIKEALVIALERIETLEHNASGRMDRIDLDVALMESNVSKRMELLDQRLKSYCRCREDATLNTAFVQFLERNRYLLKQIHSTESNQTAGEVAR